MEIVALIMIIILGFAAISALSNREYLWAINFTALAVMGLYLIEAKP